jgi:hypothetical protein
MASAGHFLFLLFFFLFSLFAGNRRKKTTENPGEHYRVGGIVRAYWSDLFCPHGIVTSMCLPLEQELVEPCRLLLLAFVFFQGLTAFKSACSDALCAVAVNNAL